MLETHNAQYSFMPVKSTEELLPKEFRLRVAFDDEDVSS